VLFDKVIRRFDADSTDANPARLFNYQPHGFRLEQASKGAYFFSNVAPSGSPLVAESSQAEACRDGSNATPLQAPCLQAGVLDG
jgi:hypothetical protein